MEIAEQVSTWSKDPSRQIGAIAVNDNRRILATGYNGFPRGVEDSEDRYNDRPTKYKLVVHAEMNVIYNAGYNGISLDGATLYVFGLPICSDCAKGIIQVGIKKIIMPSQEIPDSWYASWSLSKSMFKESGVEYEFCNYKSNK